MRATKNGVISVLLNHLIAYPTPINFSYLYGFGSLAGCCLIIQIFSGVFLAFYYIPLADSAFMSVEFIMRDLEYGWFLRYIHSNGASMFFMCVYAHIVRNLYYGSFVKPRHWTWTTGIIVFILMMATSFLGYVLPWGQMSFWAATVITNFVTILPGSDYILEWFWGGYAIDSPTLHRIFSLHYLFPFILAAATGVHLAFLHNNGSTNPLTVDSPANSIPFFPYFGIKDFFGLVVFIAFFSIFLFTYPNVLGHPDNYIYANSIKTPDSIVPEWYFLPYYAILRCIPHKTGGIVVMGLSLVIFFILPIIVDSKVKGAVFNYTYRILLFIFIADVVFLGWIGQKSTVEPYLTLGAFATLAYFLFFPLLAIVSRF